MSIMRRLLLILGLLVTAGTAAAATNYVCVVCGQGPLSGRIWMTRRGPVCPDCYQLEDRCSLCGLPIRAGDGVVKTGDGRYLCKFDKTDAVLEAAEARELFQATRRELRELFGPGFTLNFPEVTVNLFDVDYWSEQGHGDGLHKFGFSSTRRSRGGVCTHEVALLSGQPRTELVATAAHEFTHLWINENRPPEHKIRSDTEEAICELAAYKLMESRPDPEQRQKILDNPYTHGEIKRLLKFEQQNSFADILAWVKNGTNTTLTEGPMLRHAISAAMPVSLPMQLQFTGLSIIGTRRAAIVNGVDLAPGDEKVILLQNQTVHVRCREVFTNELILEVEGSADPVRLKLTRKRDIPGGQAPSKR